METNQLLRLEAHESYSYVPRTGENARGADVTVAFAVDFNTAGERLTKREAGNRYVGIPFGSDVAQAAAKLVTFMREKNAQSLNIAGNGIYTLAEHGTTQAKANQWVYDVLALVMSQVKLSAVRSGGQTGIDQAGLVAAIALNLPALGLYPARFRRRNAQGNEVTSSVPALTAELTKQASELVGPDSLWRFHEDGSLPEDEGTVFVFGSNLAGRHGKGAALVAKERFGATPGVGRGRMGRSYGIPTKRNGPVSSVTGKPSLVTLSLADIAKEVEAFIAYATHNREERFFVTRIGCNLAGYSDGEIAPMFAGAPDNCSFAVEWKPYLVVKDVQTAPAINIWSGAPGLGGALTNMSERAKEKGCIKNSYPVVVNGVTYPDSEAAYQSLKSNGNDSYNDGLMIDLIALKFKQNTILFDTVTKYGGVAWLEKCSHFTQAKSDRFQAWEGQGHGSRFIRNLIQGYLKAKTGMGPVTRVVHVKEAPFDVYIGRQMGVGAEFQGSLWQNPFKLDATTSRDDSVAQFYEYAKNNPELMAKVHTLKGRTLGCWCKSHKNLDLLCHGDVLVALAEGREWVAPQSIQGTLF